MHGLNTYILLCASTISLKPGRFPRDEGKLCFFFARFSVARVTVIYVGGGGGNEILYLCDAF